MISLIKLENANVQPAALILLIGLAFVFIPHFSHLPVWLSFLMTASLFWRATYELQLCTIPGKKVLFLFTMMLLIGILYSYHTLIGRNAGSAMLLGLLCLKLFEIKSFRDVSLIINVALFSVVINFLFSQSLPVAFIMLLALIFLFTALVGFQHDYKSLEQSRSLPLCLIRENEKQHFLLVFKMLFQAIPFAVVLFVLFPRINGPLWGLPEDAFSATTGLSDQMSPGRLSQLSNNPDVAFRVEFESTIPSRANLYWRGPVLWNFDGYNWTAPEHERTELNSFSFTALNDVIKYSVTLQPHNKFWIFALDLPADLPVGTVLSADMQILSVLPVQKLQRFNLSSYTRYVLPRTAKLSLDRYLKLPDSAGSSFGKPPLSKSRALIHQLKDSSSQLNTVDNVLNYFATQNFFYTRQPPILHDDPVDEFLFESKRGYCEHYASSFTVLMRLAGIPARVVTGYQGGELNPVDNFMTIRQSDAHAWAEVYLADNGWVRIDPTSAIPPGNIENSKDALRLNSNLKKPDHLFQSNWLSKQIKQVRFGWDAVNNRWNQWVLGYNNIKQKALFEAIGIPEISWQGLSQLLFGILAVLTGLLALIVFSTQHKSKDELQKAYFTFLKKIKKHGLVKSIHEGEGDFSLRAVKQLPEHKKSIEKITLLYQQLRYKKHHVKTLVLFKNYIKAFKP